MFVPSGKLRALAVSGDVHTALLPDTPTVAEAGVPGYSMTNWNGLVAPQRTPKPVLDKVRAALLKVLSHADVRDAMEEDLAYTSVLSALQTLEDKGYVHHEPEGRAYRYFPAVAAERAGRSALTRIKDAIFQGSAERMFTQLVSDKQLGREELERMRALLDERLGDDA